MGLSRQEYWSGLPFTLPGDLPYPGIKSTSPVSPPGAGSFFTTRVIWEALAKVNFQLFFRKVFLTSLLFLIPHVKRTGFALSKEKKNHLNQFSPESKQHHGHPVSNNLSFLSIVTALWLQYRLNSTQIDCDSRDRRTDKNLRTSLQGDGGVWSEESKGVNKLARVGEPGLPFPPQRQGQVEGDQLMERETEGLGGV